MIKTLNEVQTGDKVVLCTRGEREVVEVTRTTAMQIVCGFNKFWRKNGKKVTHDIWDFCRITPWTPEVQQEIDEQKLKKGLYSNVKSEIKLLERNLGKFSKETLQQLLSTLLEYNNK